MQKLCVALAVLGIIAVLAAGCDPVPPTVPPLKGGNEAAMIEVPVEQFMLSSQLRPVITQQVELTHPQSLIVSLVSNATTGFKWTENVQISNAGVIKQVEHNYVAPEAQNVVGAAGKQVWTFDTAGKGTTTTNMEYSQPWEGGEKRGWTFQVTVTVK